MNIYETLSRARDCLSVLTPLKTDCGRYCGCACCESDETGDNGMLLLPGEDAFYRQEIQDFPYRLIPDDSLFSGGFRLVCEGQCSREHRPFACRIFPLRLRILEDGCKCEIDPRSYALCPLPERGGMRGFDQNFVAAAREAGQILTENPVIRKALLEEQNRMDAERHL